MKYHLARRTSFNPSTRLKLYLVMRFKKIIFKFLVDQFTTHITDRNESPIRKARGPNTPNSNLFSMYNIVRFN